MRPASRGIHRLAQRLTIQEDLGVRPQDHDPARGLPGGVRQYALSHGARLRSGQLHDGVGRRPGRQWLGDLAGTDGERNAQAREQLLPAW